ncbi:hypothetical protein P7K49_028385, partial [Saguinus oedipus]
MRKFPKLAKVFAKKFGQNDSLDTSQGHLIVTDGKGKEKVVIVSIVHRTVQPDTAVGPQPCDMQIPVLVGKMTRNQEIHEMTYWRDPATSGIPSESCFIYSAGDSPGLL